MRTAVFSHVRGAVWLGFFALILAAWAGLFLLQVNAQATYWLVFAMWGLMTAAMMAPTLVPTLRTYRDLGHTEAASARTFASLVAGYLSVWLGYSAVAATLQIGLARLGVLGPGGSSLSWGFNAGLLALAGIYQFSRLKGACLSQCRSPMTFFMGHWQPGSLGAAKMGVHLGVICLGCCWALMALAFVGGTMNLLWMGIATALMVVEKLPELGRYISRPLGVFLLGASLASLLMAV
ncbi:MAG: DUF2182 domain-containing protein [Alphaproteobacteria bacterium]|nr:DUF2182 domain-containing protein [Alphaproteobacteria bacterium]